MIAYESQLLELAERLPTVRPVDHHARIKHCQEYGHIVCFMRDGILKGYAEVYVLNRPPDYPAVPYPKSVAGGRYLYCFAAVCEKGEIKNLIELGKKTFKNCEWLCYHRRKRENRLHIEENEYADRHTAKPIA